MKNPILPDTFYHIYSRGNNKETIFKEQRNYNYFLNLWRKYVTPIADTYCYSLLPNHFHFLVKVKSEQELENIESYKTKNDLYLSKSFSNLLNAYSKSINKSIGRTGSLFEENYKRKQISSIAYCKNLTLYIHTNAEKHHLFANFREHKHHSYHSITTHAPTLLMRDMVLEWFGGLDEFEKAHEHYAEQKDWWSYIFEHEKDDN